MAVWSLNVYCNIHKHFISCTAKTTYVCMKLSLFSKLYHIHVQQGILDGFHGRDCHLMCVPLGDCLARWQVSYTMYHVPCSCPVYVVSYYYLFFLLSFRLGRLCRRFPTNSLRSWRPTTSSPIHHLSDTSTVRPASNQIKVRMTVHLQCTCTYPWQHMSFGMIMEKNVFYTNTPNPMPSSTKEGERVLYCDIQKTE